MDLFTLIRTEKNEAGNGLKCNTKPNCTVNSATISYTAERFAGNCGRNFMTLLKV